jgi:hypothetical protein
MTVDDFVSGSVGGSVSGSMVCCLHQVFRPKHHFPFITPLTKGNCVVCEYDPVNNPRCSGFVPVGYRVVSVVSDYRVGGERS